MALLNKKMMYKLLLLFSHSLTEEQKEEIDYLNISQLIYLPPDLQTLWSNIPPELETLKDYLEPIFNFISQVLDKGDYILIQGDPGAVYLAVNFSYKKGFIPIYATTERRVTEIQLPNGSIKKENIFKHKRFRRYEQ